MPRRRSLRFLVCLALLALPGAVSAQPPAEAPKPLVLAGGTLVDVSNAGNAQADIKDSVVVLDGGRIVAAGPRAEVKIPGAAQVIDVTGKYVVPGLIDAFATQGNQAQANAFLYMGVTSMIGIDGEPGDRRGPLARGLKPSPRVYEMESLLGYDLDKLTPPATSLADLKARGTPQTEAELSRQIDSLARSGIKVLLLHYPMTPEQVRTAVRRARELGLATIGEFGTTTYYQGIEAGVHAFVHTSRYSLEMTPPELRQAVADMPFGPPRIKFYEFLVGLGPDDPRLASHAAKLAAGKTSLIPTLSLIYLDLPDHENPWKEPIAAILDPKDIHLPANPATGQVEKGPADPRNDFPPGVAEKTLQIETQYRKAGARYLAGSGTDAFGTLPGISLHTELKLLTRIGLTPRQALAAATSNFGETFGWPTIGQVKPGYDADLLVLDADPTRDVGNLKKIRMVILDGEILDRDRLLAK